MSEKKEQRENDFRQNECKPSADRMQMPKINFTTFVLSLNSSALVNLGIEKDPISGALSVNLPIAKQTIDIIAMLEEKTRGNLAEDEQRLLSHVLYELRILYIKKGDGL